MKLFLIVLSLVIVACDASAITARGGKPTTLSTTPISTSTTVPTTLIITASDYLNLRNIPDAYGPNNSSIIVTMPAGTHVTWLRECRGTWSKVDYEGLIGWANNQWMKPEVCK